MAATEELGVAIKTAVMLQRVLELQNCTVTLFLVQTSEHACSFILHEAHKRMKCIT
jgi:hypothetical protein